ncbi:MAG: hypothetical protein AAGK09_04730 [Planctomycetota bacterium]
MPASPVRRVRRASRAIPTVSRRRDLRAWLTGTLGTAVLAAAAVAMPARPAAADVMTMAPEDVEILMVVPDPKGMSDRIATLSERMGMPMPGAQNILDTMMSQLGNPQGVDDAKPLAMAMGNAAEAMSMQDDSLMTSMVFVPVEDYGAFVSSLGGASATGVTPLVLTDGSEAFVRQSGDYAVVGNNEAAVTGYAPSDRAKQLVAAAGDYAGRLTAEPDVMVVVDMATLGPAMAEQAEAFDGAMMGNPGMDPAAANAMAANMSSMVWIADLASGAEAAVMSLDLAGDDIKLGLCAKFAVDASASLILTDKPAQPVASRFAALPDMPYLLAFGMDFTGVDMAELTQQLADALPEDATAQRKMYEASIPMLKQATGGAMGMYVPSQPAMGLSGLFNVAAVYDVDDADGFVDAFEHYIKAVDGVAMPVPVPGEGGEMTTADMITQASLTPDALTLGGVSLSEWSMAQQMPPELMQQMGPMAGMMQQAYAGYVGASDGKAYVTTGSDIALLTATVEGAGEGLAADGPTQTALANDDVPDRAVAGFLSLQGVGAMANSYLPMFGLPAIEVPADIAPLGLSMGASKGQMIVEVTLPVDSLAFIAEEAMQIQAMMGGGPAPGAGMGGGGTPRAPQ